MPHNKNIKVNGVQIMELKQLTNRIFYLPNSHETDRPLLAAIIGDQYTIMMDGGNSPYHAQLFLSELERKGLKQPDFVVLTHWHWDHILGYSSLNIPAFAHKQTKELMMKLSEYEWDDHSIAEQVKNGITTSACAEYIKKEFGQNRQEIQIKLPQITFDDEIIIDLGNVTCKIKHVGGDHAPDSSILFIEEEKVLFVGDSYSPCIHAPKRFYQLQTISELLKTLSSFDASYVVHSHALPMTKIEFQKEMKEFNDIIAAVEKYGDDLGKIQKVISSLWDRDLPEEEIGFIQYFINGLK
jgi:glyoxylase-like metal-dependent hydrolase (beta-lactamase superfamily II)